MIINVEKWIIRDKDSHYHDVISYKLKSAEYCCEGIKQIKNIDLYYTSPENKLPDGEDYNVGLMIKNTEYYHDAYEDIPDYTNAYYMVEYCPCCGFPVIINVIGEIDKTDEYNAINDERERFHNKWCKSDSIQERYTLENKRRELDRAIEIYYNTDVLNRGEDDE